MSFLDKAKAKLEEAAKNAKPMAEKLQERAKPMAEKAQVKAGEAFESVKKSAEGFREGLTKDDPADAPAAAEQSANATCSPDAAASCDRLRRWRHRPHHRRRPRPPRPGAAGRSGSAGQLTFMDVSSMTNEVWSTLSSVPVNAIVIVWPA